MDALPVLCNGKYPCAAATTTHWNYIQSIGSNIHSLCRVDQRRQKQITHLLWQIKQDTNMNYHATEFVNVCLKHAAPPTMQSNLYNILGRAHM